MAGLAAFAVMWQMQRSHAHKLWDAAARERMARIPSFVRGVVMQRVEEYARKRGKREITPELLSEVRSALPVDFSKKRPFFVTDV